MTLARYEAVNIIARIKYKDWQFIVHDHPDFYLQLKFQNGGAIQTGRKWRLSEHMTKSELVQTVFKAVLTAEEHEARESFSYNGAPIFGPHFDVDHLADLYQTSLPDIRITVNTK